MAISYNGWPASPDRDAVNLTDLTVGGVSFVPGVRAGDVHTVLGYVAEQFHERVEALVDGWCWGYAYRENRNAGNLSNHASATAIDANAPRHPNGVPTRETFTAQQIDEVHQILAEVDHVVRWGGDYTGTPDAMHFEINAGPAEVARVAERIRTEGAPVSIKLSDIFRYRLYGKKGGRRTLADVLRQISSDVAAIRRDVDDIKSQNRKVQS